MRSKYQRVLLKLSGESLAGAKGTGIDTERLGQYAEQIKEIASSGVEVAIVIGGGNIFRGLSGATRGFDRVKGDQMGMLATVINSLALSSALESVGQPARVLTAINMFPIGEHYSKWKAIEALKRGEVAIIAGGHRQSVLHHRYGQRSARHRGGSRRDAERNESRRRVHGRSGEGLDGHQVQRDKL